MAAEIRDVQFHDAGPHVLPLLAECQAIVLGENFRERAVLRFLCEGGPVLHVPISARTLPSLIFALKSWQDKIAECAPSQSPKH